MSKKRGRPKQSEKNPLAAYRGRPRKEDKNIQVCLTIPFKLERAIERIAKKKHKSFSSTVVGFLSEVLNA